MFCNDRVNAWPDINTKLELSIISQVHITSRYILWWSCEENYFRKYSVTKKKKHKTWFSPSLPPWIDHGHLSFIEFGPIYRSYLENGRRFAHIRWIPVISQIDEKHGGDKAFQFSRKNRAEAKRWISRLKTWRGQSVEFLDWKRGGGKALRFSN